MYLELCPLLLATLPKGSVRNMALCQKENCMWFYHFDGQPEGKGLCSVSRLGSELSELNINLNKFRIIFQKPE